jgi:DNA topoisomerase-2
VNPIAKDIKDVFEDCTETRINIVIEFEPNKLNQYVQSNKLESLLGLCVSESNTNMHLYNANRYINKYDSYNKIIDEYMEVRLEYYQKRKDWLLKKYENEKNYNDWILKFVKAVRAEQIIVYKKSKAELISQLQEQNYPKLSANGTYDYLTTIPIVNFTTDQIAKLENEIRELKNKIKILKGKTTHDLWSEDLDEFIQTYDKWDNFMTAKYQKDLLENAANIKKKRNNRK